MGCGADHATMENYDVHIDDGRLKVMGGAIASFARKVATSTPNDNPATLASVEIDYRIMNILNSSATRVCEPFVRYFVLIRQHRVISCIPDAISARSH